MVRYTKPKIISIDAFSSGRDNEVSGFDVFCIFDFGQSA